MSINIKKYLRSMNHLSSAHSIGEGLEDQIKTFKEMAEYGVSKFLVNHHRCKESEDGLYKYGFDLETGVSVFDRTNVTALYVTTLWIIKCITFPTGSGTMHVVCCDEDGHKTYFESLDVCDINKILEQLKGELPILANEEMF